MSKIVNHVNLADSEGRVYCKKLGNVVVLDGDHIKNFCSGCNMYAGSAQGNGIECEWTDSRDVFSPHVVNDPTVESDSINVEEMKKRRKR